MACIPSLRGQLHKRKKKKNAILSLQRNHIHDSDKKNGHYELNPRRMYLHLHLQYSSLSTHLLARCNIAARGGFGGEGRHQTQALIAYECGSSWPRVNSLCEVFSP